MPHSRRIAALRERLSADSAAAALALSQESRRWLTGFTGSNGQVIVDGARVILLTDGRYRAQAAAEAGAVVDDIVIYEAFEEAAARLLVGDVAVESSALTFEQWTRWADALPAVRLLDGGAVWQGLRAIKDEAEIAAIREAVRRAEAAWQAVEPTLGPGRVERDIALDLEWHIRKAGAHSVPFDFIVASGARSALPHGVAGDRVLSGGDALTIDFGAEAGGYFSDMTFSGSLGGDSWIAEICAVLVDAQAAAIAAIAPGVACREVDGAARAVIEKAGFGEAFVHSLGHGVGLAIHEAPTLSRRSADVLAAGMVVTVEPGIYVSGRGGARLEDMVLVTDHGAERLTTIPKAGMVWG